MTVTAFPLQQSAITYGEDVFYRLLADLFSEGIVAATDLQVTQRGAGANMSVDVAAGDAFVDFDTPYGGKRRVRNDATSNSGTPGSPGADWAATFVAADPSNPRIDRVVLEVKDSLLDASGLYKGRFRVVAGVATAGATLANPNGAATVPANAVLLANVLIDAGATSITNAKIDTTVRVRTNIGAGAALVGGSGAQVVKTTFATLDVVSTTTETPIVNYLIPGGLLTSTGGLIVKAWGDCLQATGSNANRPTFRIRWGATTTLTGTIIWGDALAGSAWGSSSTRRTWWLEAHLKNDGSVSVQTLGGLICWQDVGVAGSLAGEGDLTDVTTGGHYLGVIAAPNSQSGMNRNTGSDSLLEITEVNGTSNANYSFRRLGGYVAVYA